jgi:hypothetical protein
MPTNDEKRLAQIIVGLYKLVRLQQESIAKVMVQNQALGDALQSTPELAKALDAALATARTSQTSQMLADSLKIIDATIQSLQSTYGPWTN